MDGNFTFLKLWGPGFLSQAVGSPAEEGVQPHCPPEELGPETRASRELQPQGWGLGATPALPSFWWAAFLPPQLPGLGLDVGSVRSTHQKGFPPQSTQRVSSAVQGELCFTRYGSFLKPDKTSLALQIQSSRSDAKQQAVDGPQARKQSFPTEVTWLTPIL